MNLDQTPQPAERAGMGNRISDLWKSRKRMATVFMLVASGLVLNCCCLIIPLWGSTGGP